MNRALAIAAILSFLVPVSGFAFGTPDETCDIAGTGTLECPEGEGCSWTGTGPTGCTEMSGDDLIRISGGVATVGPAGVHAEPSGASMCTNCGIEVENGAVFDQTVPDGSANAISAYVSRLGELGLDCEDGSTCNLVGKVLDGYGTTNVILSSALPALGPVVGELVPCPNTDGSECLGTDTEGVDDTLRIEWPESDYGPWDGEGATNLDDFLVAIEPGSDYICAYRFDEYGPAPRYLPGWLNQCYRISGVSLPTDDPLWIDIDILQGEADAEIQPLSRRMIFQGTLQSDVSAGPGGRTFYLSEGTLPSSPSPGTDWDRIWMDGAWLYFEQLQSDTDGCLAGDGCRPEPRPYRLMEARPDDTCAPGSLSARDSCSVDSDCDQTVEGDGLGECLDGDLVIIADENGADASHLSGTTVWIGLGLGFAIGDRFAVVRPSRIASNDSDKSDAPTRLHFGGQMSLQFAHFEHPGDLLVTSCPALWEHIWVTDSMGGEGNGQNSDALFDGKMSTSCHNWGQTTLTGTDPRSVTAMSNTEHGISFETASNLHHEQAHTFNDWALRYHNDDCVDIHSSTSEFITEMRFTGLFSCEYVGQGDSGSLFDGHGGKWCDAENLNAQMGCGTNADCDLSSPGDGQGTCVAAPQIFEAESASCVNCAIDDDTSADDIGSILCVGRNFGGLQKGVVSVGGMVSPGAPCNFLDFTFLGGETDKNNGTWLRRANGLVVREAANHEGSMMGLVGVAQDGGHLLNAYLHSTPDLERISVRGDDVQIENLTLVNEDGAAHIDASNQYSDTTVENVTIVGKQGSGTHRFAGLPSSLGTDIEIGGILLVNDSSNSVVKRMTYDGIGFDQPNISYSGSWCFHSVTNGFFNTTDEQDLVDAGMPVNYFEDAEFETGTWSPLEGGAADIAECGALPGLESPGIHFVNDALLVNKLMPECAATECVVERSEVTCGDSVVDPLEQCDDGNLERGDGCSERCAFEMSVIVQSFAGEASVGLWIDSVPIAVQVTAGQSVEDVAEALAQTINNHSGLQTRGTRALASGATLFTDGRIDVITLDAFIWPGSSALPALGTGAQRVLLAVLVAVAILALRKRSPGP